MATQDIPPCNPRPRFPCDYPLFRNVKLVSRVSFLSMQLLQHNCLKTRVSIVVKIPFQSRGGIERPFKSIFPREGPTPVCREFAIGRSMCFWIVSRCVNSFFWRLSEQLEKERKTVLLTLFTSYGHWEKKTLNWWLRFTRCFVFVKKAYSKIHIDIYV